MGRCTLIKVGIACEKLPKHFSGVILEASILADSDEHFLALLEILWIYFLPKHDILATVPPAYLCQLPILKAA